MDSYTASKRLVFRRWLAANDGNIGFYRFSPNTKDWLHSKFTASLEVIEKELVDQLGMDDAMRFINGENPDELMKQLRCEYCHCMRVAPDSFFETDHGLCPGCLEWYKSGREGADSGTDWVDALCYTGQAKAMLRVQQQLDAVDERLARKNAVLVETDGINLLDQQAKARVKHDQERWEAGDDMDREYDAAKQGGWL